MKPLFVFSAYSFVYMNISAKAICLNVYTIGLQISFELGQLFNHYNYFPVVGVEPTNYKIHVTIPHTGMLV